MSVTDRVDEGPAAVVINLVGLLHREHPLLREVKVHRERGLMAIIGVIGGSLWSVRRADGTIWKLNRSVGPELVTSRIQLDRGLSRNQAKLGHT